MEWTKLSQHAETAFNRFGGYFAFWFALTLPWSLTLSYFGLFPLLVLWLMGYWHAIPRCIQETRPVTLPFLFFMAAFFLASTFGVDPVRSLRSIPATLFFAVAILAIRQVVLRQGPTAIVSALVSGQVVAGLQSAFYAAFPTIVPKLFLGAVTEAGQLAITSLLAMGLTFSLSPSAAKPGTVRASPSLFLFSILITALWVGFSYTAANFSESSVLSFFLWALTGSLLGVAVLLYRKSPLQDIPAQNARRVRALYLFAIPLLLTALVVNLKRGPWMGVFIGGTIFLFLYHPRLLFPLIGLALIGFVTLEPVRERIAEIPQHFYIVGGRSMMWDIGVELSTRYPLGVGLRNSRFLQTFSSEIPPELNHFHNNFINIVVEGGWLTLMMFVWWIASILRYTFSPRFSGSWKPLAHSIGCAVISWQVAGLVEYNWGDSEVRLLVFLALGVLLGSRSPPTQPAAGF